MFSYIAGPTPPPPSEEQELTQIFMSSWLLHVSSSLFLLSPTFHPSVLPDGLPCELPAPASDAKSYRDCLTNSSDGKVKSL